MKKILFAILLLVIIAGVAPKFIGAIVETEHNAFIDKLNQGEGVVVSSKSFERNWFSGNSVSEITVTLPDEGLGNITFVVEETLTFGPVIFSEEGLDFGLSHATAHINIKEFLFDDEVIDYLNDKVKITGLLTFSKDIVTRLNIDEITKEVDGNSFFSEKASGTFVIKHDTKLLADFAWGGLKIKDSNNTVTVGAVSITADQELLFGDIYSGGGIAIGDVEVVVDEISVLDELGNVLGDVTNLSFTANASAKDDLLNARFVYNADKLTSIEQTFKNANLALEFDNFDLQTIQELNALAETAPAQIDDTFIAQNQAAALALVVKLLQKDPVIKLSNLSAETEQGKMLSVAQLTVDKTLFDANNPMSIMAALTAKADGEAPEAFISKIGMAPMADMYVQQGLLTKKEGQLVFDLGYSQGQLKINGNVMPMH